MEGVYYRTRESGPIELTDQDSNLVIKGEDGKKVVISGAIKLDNLNWLNYNSPHDSSSNIKVADVSGYSKYLSTLSSMYVSKNINDELGEYVHGVRARFPNANTYTQGLWTKGNTGLLSPSVVSKWGKNGKGPSKTVIKRSVRPASKKYPKFLIGFGGSSSIFDPPVSYWAVRNPVAGGGCMFEVPASVHIKKPFGKIQNFNGFKHGNDIYTNILHWKYWGNWIFKNKVTTNTIASFQKGGFQEARGKKKKNIFFNILKQ